MKKQVITSENVKHFGELIAISAIKKVMPYCGEEMFQLYKGLIHDTFSEKPVDEPYSNGYDLAMTAICFLCEHMGETLDTEFVSKYGKTITIRLACYREVYNYIQKLRVHVYNNIELDSLSPSQEPTIEMEQQEETDYSTYDALLKRMHLNKGQQETLNCYMAGMTFVEIAKFLSVNKATVWRHRQQLQQKYAYATN